MYLLINWEKKSKPKRKVFTAERLRKHDVMFCLIKDQSGIKFGQLLQDDETIAQELKNIFAKRKLTHKID